MTIEERVPLKQPHLTITGNAASNGGQFQTVKITGEATIHESTTCSSFRCIGTSQCNGSLHTQQMKLVGTCYVAGSLRAQRVRVIGELITNEQSEIQYASITGSIVHQHAEGAIHVNKLNGSGHIRSAGGYCGDSLHFQGILHIEQLLSADYIDLQLAGQSFAGEIGGERITIRRLHPFLRLIAHCKQLFTRTRHKAHMTSHLIEGDTIYLEHTSAETVRGYSVHIGPGCSIGTLEYRTVCQVDHNSNVRTVIRI